VLVAGGTGRTGRFVVEDLIRSGVKVRGLTRSPERAKDQAPNAEWVEGDVRNPSSLIAAFQDVDRIISVLGATETTGPNSPEAVEYQGNVNLIDLAISNGAKQLVMITSLSAGRVDSEPALAERFRGMGWKNKAEHYLRGSGLPYTIVGPGGLRDYDGGMQGIELQPEDQIKTGVISRADVGAVMAEASRNPNALMKTLRIVNDASLPVNGWRSELATVPKDA
jgi:uncharacterized protein YbjT (DUF2867 family)